MNTAIEPIRIYTLKGPRSILALDDGTGLWDLSAFLRANGRPADLFELSEDGWFSPSQLEDRLPRKGGEGWEPLEVDGEGLPAMPLALPVPRETVGKILALGKNFKEHAAEFQEEVPEEPLFFNKLPETLVPSGSEVRVRKWYAGRVDHEVELAVIIGLGGSDFAEEDAMEHVAFYTLANDLTARTLQGIDRKKGYPWFRAKNMDDFCPLGPALVPREYLDGAAVHLTCKVNGELRQDARTRDMVVSIPAALAYLSTHLTLNPGDIVLMGTPSGVGPLAHGDRVVCHAPSIGRLDTTILRD
ncbi:MAG: fumarylacetoacetate hydrolase family protein [Planctomycetes bacterium]|nr:fumarylacetoacetate hydrolase family protein [Planctomycetota bacterium]